jgi:hypothetical protein
MIKKNLLEARMKENNIEYPALSKLIGMSYQSLRWRLWGRTEFRLSEIKAIKKVLNLTTEQTIEIFFLED